MCRIFFKVKDSYLFDGEGYISINAKSVNEKEIYQYRKIVADQTDTDVSNIIQINE